MEKIRTIDRQNAALNIRILSDIGLSENGKTPERRKEAKERLERNKATFEKNEKEKTELLKQLDIKDPFLERQREELEKGKKKWIF